MVAILRGVPFIQVQYLIQCCQVLLLQADLPDQFIRELCTSFFVDFPSDYVLVIKKVILFKIGSRELGKKTTPLLKSKIYCIFSAKDMFSSLNLLNIKFGVRIFCKLSFIHFCDYRNYEKFVMHNWKVSVHGVTQPYILVLPFQFRKLC